MAVMRLTSAIVTDVRNGKRFKSKVLVNMDKFVDAVPSTGGLISLWFEGPFSMTMEKKDFVSLLCAVGSFSKLDAMELVPSDEISIKDFQAPSGAWGNHIS